MGGSHNWLGHVTYNRKIGVRLSVLLPYASMVFNGSMTAFQAVGAGSNPVRRWSMFLITFTWYRLFKTDNEIIKWACIPIGRGSWLKPSSVKIRILPRLPINLTK